VTVPPGEIISDALFSSPIIVEEGGVPGSTDAYGGVDPNIDPELAMVLQMSLEEERVREAEAKKEREKGKTEQDKTDATSTQSTPSNQTETSAATTQKTQEPTSGVVSDVDMPDEDDEESELVRAIQMSLASAQAEKKQTRRKKTATTSFHPRN